MFVVRFFFFFASCEASSFPWTLESGFARTMVIRQQYSALWGLRLPDPRDFFSTQYLISLLHFF